MLINHIKLIMNINKNFNIEINDGVFDSFPVLKTDRLILRSFEIEDAPYLFSMRTDDKVMQYVDSTRPKKLKDTEEKIVQMKNDFDHKKGISWAITSKKSNKVIGYAGLWRLWKEHLRAEIGYLLHPEFWGHGIMFEALTIILTFSFQKLQLHSIEANVNEQNIVSMTLLRRLGFQKEAFFRENYYFEGRFLNSVIFCLLEQDFEKGFIHKVLPSNQLP